MATVRSRRSLEYVCGCQDWDGRERFPGSDESEDDDNDDNDNDNETWK